MLSSFDCAASTERHNAFLQRRLSVICYWLIIKMSESGGKARDDVVQAGIFFRGGFEHQ
jgi:hypothetical protein